MSRMSITKCFDVAVRRRSRTLMRVAVLAAVVGASASCGNVIRQGRSPVYIVIDTLQGAQGNKPSSLSTVLSSDVQTIVTSPAPCSTTNPCPTIFNDVGQAVLRLSPKNIGTSTSPTVVTTNNEVTISQIHIDYRRADGRNTPGVDVPYAFDAAATGTIPAGGTLTLPFELVRDVAKEESPLVELVNSPTIITTIANVTFYGTDQVGNAVSVTGTIQIDFGNFGDQ
jgi:hypothetical protein